MKIYGNNLPFIQMKLPYELVYIILQYLGELRILKRKMTRENMFQIINDDKRINKSFIDFAFDIVESPFYNHSFYYYWYVLSNIKFNKKMNTVFMKNGIVYEMPESFIEELLKIIINDYNYYYLDDEYYYKVWNTGICYIFDDSYNSSDIISYSTKYHKEKKREIESLRTDFFNKLTTFFQLFNIPR